MKNRLSKIVFNKPLKKSILFLAICYMPYAILGCGYTTRSLISGKYRTIYVPPFSNAIDITSEAKAGRDYQLYYPVLEVDVTGSVIDRFMLDGNLRVEKDEAADLVLRGSVVDYRRDVLRYESDDTPEEYRISIAVDLSLWDKKENRLVWREKRLVGDTTYFLSGPNEATAVASAIEDLARRIVARTVEDW